MNEINISNMQDEILKLNETVETLIHILINLSMDNRGDISAFDSRNLKKLLDEYLYE